MSELELLNRRFERERKARKEAESLLEQKSLAVYEANQKLQRMADQNRAIVETAAEGILSYDENGTISAFNRSARLIFKCPSMVGKSISSVFAMDDSCRAVLFPASNVATDVFPPGAELATTDDTEVCQFTLPDAIEVAATKFDGKPFQSEVAVSRCQRGDGVVFTAVVRDLSKRKAMESRLRQAQKMESVGQLAAGIAHEINTPIQFVGDNIQFLQSAFNDLAGLIDLFEQLEKAVAEETPTAELLEKIATERELADLPFLREEFPGAIEQSLSGIERVAKIVRALKEFSQPMSEAKTSIDVNRSIENTLAVTANQCRNVGHVELDLSADLGLVSCLAGQMNQVWLNLLTNSLDAVTEHRAEGERHIRISTRLVANDSLEDEVEVCFEDNGPGIPAAIQERIFEPFFTTKEVGKGAGQGLSFVHDVIVEKHGGIIYVQSPPQGGTRVVVRLPIQCDSSIQRRTHARSAY
ncbi:PAS domain-containing sensor histidine kinase [Rubripirellula reticaptiva]|uniref:histidine kinase n=1 Tax=Rubripirellula reticaptiva TaxID=2528013 RepID=A0A5C6EF97_9BACT|nr:ATP-binding protein [Rubripirellula reticaptiva]TWU47672.1 Blue-light-activated protein [Rubripirellula reticaptiva]